jgi:hypothetical protein
VLLINLTRKNTARYGVSRGAKDTLVRNIIFVRKSISDISNSFAKPQLYAVQMNSKFNKYRLCCHGRHPEASIIVLYVKVYNWFVKIN